MSESRINSKQLTEISILLALAIVIELAFRVIPRQPQGGSIDLTMLPLFIIAYRQGLQKGILAGMVFGLLNLLISGLALYHWGVLFFDYLFAFGVLGLSALFFRINKDSVKYFVVGVVVAGMLRFVFHYLSGIIFFGEFAPEGTPVALYSLTYNMTYMAPSIALTAIVGALLFVRLREILQQDLT